MREQGLHERPVQHRVPAEGARSFTHMKLMCYLQMRDNELEEALCDGIVRARASEPAICDRSPGGT